MAAAKGKCCSSAVRASDFESGGCGFDSCWVLGFFLALSSPTFIHFIKECPFYIYMDTQDHAIYRVWIQFIPTSLYPRREKTFGLSWN